MVEKSARYRWNSSDDVFEKKMDVIFAMKLSALLGMNSDIIWSYLGHTGVFNPHFPKHIPEYIGIFLNFPCDWLVWFKRSVCRPYFTLTKKCIWKAPTKNKKNCWLKRSLSSFGNTHVLGEFTSINMSKCFFTGPFLEVVCSLKHHGIVEQDVQTNISSRIMQCNTHDISIYEYIYLFIYGCMVCYIHYGVFICMA